MRFPHSILLAVCIALFPAGAAWSQGGGGAGAGGAGSGAAGAGAAGAGGGRGGVGTSATSGGAAVGGGAPAGAVGGGAPAGAVGGGAPTNTVATPGSDPASNAAAANSTAANPSSAGGPTGIGAPSGVQGSGRQGGAPPVMGQAQPTTVPPEVRGVADFPPATTTGLATTAEDGVSTKIVPARPCSTAARETDGTTTCVGIPSRRK